MKSIIIKRSLKLFFMVCVLMCAYTGKAQDVSLDSLKNVLSQSVEDTNKVKVLLELSRIMGNNATNEGLSYSILAKDLAIKLDYKKGLALAYKNIGKSYYILGNYLEAFNAWD
ncbi:MAG TPA: hypothetical protein PLO59_05970, partial [Bacteroidia bacterium]|nr:hypothetical protein [Bacteroidia bacterium]